MSINIWKSAASLGLMSQRQRKQGITFHEFLMNFSLGLIIKCLYTIQNQDSFHTSAIKW